MKFNLLFIILTASFIRGMEIYDIKKSGTRSGSIMYVVNYKNKTCESITRYHDGAYVYQRFGIVHSAQTIEEQRGLFDRVEKMYNDQQKNNSNNNN
jgi:hypothetical protein